MVDYGVEVERHLAFLVECCGAFGSINKVKSFWLGWIVGSWSLFWALFISFVLGTAYSINKQNQTKPKAASPRQRRRPHLGNPLSSQPHLGDGGLSLSSQPHLRCPRRTKSLPI